MVVVSGSWVKNVATYPTPANNNDMVIPTTNNIMSAKAILICRPNSHPFQERTLTLDQPVKVGRSVARARATPTNAIFDCKVLSRHHALLWYDCGKFYLQDTKSSNGTFVNNNRLPSSDSEAHEVCSGDIVQFGVDVVENNRKVTHCCIVATLKLYLADGKEAKASPSITETNRHGLVPLDELYKLNQIIQEACQREQCLESKLTALQNVVEETRRSADESWQAYIGEERLLSRVATLENQLAQVSKNITDEKLREELDKLQEERVSYQLAAKEALRKLHDERLEAVTLATEQEHAKLTAQQETTLAKEQLTQVQHELQDIALKLMMEQKKLDEEKAQSEQRERELQAKVDSESQLIKDLQIKLEQFKLVVNNSAKDMLPLEDLEKCNLIYTDNLKSKEEILGENENCEVDHQSEQNHINLRVAPVNDDDQDTDIESDDTNLLESSQGDCELYGKDESEKEVNCESELVKDDQEISHQQNGDDSNYKEREDTNKIDSKTLKFQFQSIQNELKKQIDQLQHQSVVNRGKISELEASLTEEKEISFRKNEECAFLKRELVALQEKLTETYNEIEEIRHNEYKQIECVELNSSISNNSLSVEQIASLEEELVILKERFSDLNNEKVTLNRNLLAMQDKYRTLCNRSHTTIFFYIAPLVAIVVYLLISQHFS